MLSYVKVIENRINNKLIITFKTRKWHPLYWLVSIIDYFRRLNER